MSAAPVTITPEQIQTGGSVTLSTKLSGGPPPYSYGVKFTPDSIRAIENQESANGDINHEFTAAVPAGTDIAYVVDRTDANETSFALNKDGKQKIPVR
jgi:hypothetical protein